LKGIIEKYSANKYLVLAIIIILTSAIYIKTFKNDLINWDDYQYITLNKSIKDFSCDGIKNIIVSFTDDKLPVTLLSFAIDYKLWKLNPMFYHAENLIFHLINIILVFVFINHLFKKKEIPIITALVFAIHPFHVESVVWVSERKDMLFTFFYLSGLITYILFLKQNRYKYLIITFIFSVLSLLSKFAAITFPIILFIIDYYYSRKLTIKSIIEKIPFFILPIISGIIHFISNSNGPTIIPVIKFSLIDRIFMATYSLLYYLIGFLFPHNFSLVHPYPIKINNFLPINYYLSFVFIIVITFLTYYFTKKRNEKEIIYGLLFFLVTISIVLHIIPFGGNIIVGERYSYIPYIGLSVIIGHFYAKIKKQYYKGLFNFIFLIYILFFSVTSYNRVKVWKNSITILSDVAYKYDVDLVYNNLGAAKYDVKDYQGAINEYNKAIIMYPEFISAYYYRGLSKYEIKDYNGAINDFSKVIVLNPNNIETYFYRGKSKQNIQDYKGTINDFDIVIEHNSSDYSTYNNRGNCKKSINDYKSALIDFDKAVKINSGFSESYYNRANTKYAIKDIEGAINDFNNAIKLNPRFEDAYNNRGVINYELKKYDEAIIDMTNVISLNPNNALAYFIKGMAYFNINKLNLSCENWEKANILGNQQAGEMINKYCKNK